MEVRVAVLAGLRARVTQVETAREAVQPVIQKVRSIDLTLLIRAFNHNKAAIEGRDAFLVQLPLQPKKVIAEYVASHGIDIPRIFSNLKAALRSGKPFWIRSEHPQDYFGASGIMDSHLIDSQKIKVLKAELSRNADLQAELEKGLLSGDHSKKVAIKLWELLGLSNEQFDEQASYSYWEALSGYNRALGRLAALYG